MVERFSRESQSDWSPGRTGRTRPADEPFGGPDGSEDERERVWTTPTLRKLEPGSPEYLRAQAAFRLMT